PLIGRRPAVAAVRRLLLANSRLVTLTGPPGVGKTRLALQVAAELDSAFEDGVFLVTLATVHDPHLVATAVCQALGLQESGMSALDRLKLNLRDKHLLLLLDNFEQIVPAAELLGELLTVCPWLHLLVTSRTPLHLRAERQFPVAPLAVPDLSSLNGAEMTDYAAVALFVERAQTVQPDFALTPENAATVAALCVRLDGLPLAIELVAARIKVLPPATLLARLDGHWLLTSDGPRDLPVRHQTLRHAIGWSYDLLMAGEQHLLAQLGIFMGGFTLEAAEAVCAGNNIFASIASLVDKSLLRATLDDGEPRFVLLETIHDYALEQLTVGGELPVMQQRHAAFFLWLAETAEPHLKGDEQLVWVKRLDVERANLRAALTWCTSDDGDPVLGLRLANALGRYWYWRALYGEGSRWLDTLLACAGERAPAALRAWALYYNCLLATGLDDFTRGIRLGEAALVLARAQPDPRLVAHIGWPLGNHSTNQSSLRLDPGGKR
ncbi:MAG: NACHT domain-containing protein, partial [Chloroflexota bacterium]|nr:NACHT domain-containing protein [Chloroflexota bacterium]